MWPPMQWQRDPTLTSAHPEAAAPASCSEGRKAVLPSCHHSEPSWSLCSGCWVSAQWPKCQEGMCGHLVPPSTPPVCTCLLLASRDRLDQDWWFLIGVMGTAPGETKGVWEKTTPWYRWAWWHISAIPALRKLRQGDGEFKPWRPAWDT